MGRMLHKSWRDGPGGKWTRRIKWYVNPKELDDIRLNILDPSAEVNIHPENRMLAQDIWERFLNDEADSLSLLAEYTPYPPEEKTFKFGPNTGKKKGR